MPQTTDQPAVPAIIRVLAEWEDKNGALSGILPEEWMALLPAVSDAAVIQSPRMVRAVPLVAEAPREPTRDEYHAANQCLDAAVLHLTGSTTWPEGWLPLRDQLLGIMRSAYRAAPPVSLAPMPEQPNTDSVHLADNGRKAVQGLDAAAGVAVDDTALNDAQLAALRADVIKRAEAIPGGPFQMYEKGRYTGLMNAIDPRSPHCTRDPALAAEFHARLIAEVAAMTSNTEKEPK